MESSYPHSYGDLVKKNTKNWAATWTCLVLPTSVYAWKPFTLILDPSMPLREGKMLKSHNYHENKQLI